MSKQKTPLKDKAKYKLLIYFKDGNARTFYSRDKPNSEKGYKRLKQYLDNVAGKYDTAIIYDLDTGFEVEKFVNDLKVPV